IVATRRGRRPAFGTRALKDTAKVIRPLRGPIRVNQPLLVTPYLKESWALGCTLSRWRIRRQRLMVTVFTRRDFTRTRGAIYHEKNTLLYGGVGSFAYGQCLGSEWLSRQWATSGLYPT